MNSREVARKAYNKKKYNSIKKTYGRADNGLLVIFKNPLFKISFGICVALFISLSAIINATASNSVENVDKQYKSVLINDGDTLWDIAAEHNNQALSCISNSEYVEDIMDINNISGDTITAGNYIIVPIYVAGH